VSCTIISLETKGSKHPTVTLTVSEGGKRQKYTVTEGTYRDIGCPLSGDDISEDTLAKMARADGERRAMAKALSLLSYADNSEARLYSKLIAAGFSGDIAALVKEECVRLGYIDEERQIARIITRCHKGSLGPYKILYKLSSLGYARSRSVYVLRGMQADGSVDFDKTKAQLISMLPEDSTLNDKQKLLKKYGYLKC